MTLLQEIGEFGLIERLRHIVDTTPVTPLSTSTHTHRVQLGIGDDAAIWQPTPGKQLTLSCDAFVEGRHFFPIQHASTKALHEIGARVANANLSDIASMAALPCFAMVSLAIPQRVTVEAIEALYTGLTHTLHRTGAHIIGGNVTSGTTELLVDITVAGEVDAGRAAQRHNAQVGDWIGVTGHPGQSALGLAIAMQPEQITPSSNHTNALLRAYLSPTARLDEAQQLAPYIHAMTDISDGFVSDLQNLLSHNQLSAHLPIDAIENALSPLQNEYYKQRSIPPHHGIQQPSDDYELLFAAPPKHIDAIDQAFATHNTPIHWLGRITNDKEPGIFFIHPNGTKEPTHAMGWDHFTEA